jgi:hypothetical protein
VLGCALHPSPFTAGTTTLGAERERLLQEIEALPRSEKIAHLVRALRAPSEVRRAAAVRVLGLSFLLAPPEMKGIAERLRDPSAEVRHHAAVALLAQLPALETSAGKVAQVPALPEGAGAPSRARPGHPGTIANALTRESFDELRRVLERALDRAASPAPGPAASDSVLRILDRATQGMPFPMPQGSSVLPP